MPSGGLAQASGGDTFSPTQFGLALLLPAFFTANRSPSLKLDEEIVNGSAAYAAVCARQKAAAAAAVTVTDFIKPIGFTPCVVAVVSTCPRRQATPADCAYPFNTSSFRTLQISR